MKMTSVAMAFSLLCLAWTNAMATEQAHSVDAPVPPTASCASLKQVDLTGLGGKGSVITEAADETSDGISVCSVKGKLAPEIQFQVLLPMKTWTGRYLQVGCGGLCGQITLRSGASNGCKILNDGGFVMAATDMGHSGQDASWGLDEQRRVDFAYRAQHLTAEAAKRLIQAFYGRAEAYSYFNGCSDGGREALMEAERYPEDFDGVIAGAPAMLFQVQNTLYHGWQARSNTDGSGQAILLSAKLPVLHRAVVEACDRDDGLRDGLISEPAACQFDVSSITCSAGQADTSQCLTEEEARVASKFYEGPKDEKTGQPLTAGQPLYGSELNWQGVYVPDDPKGMMMSPMAALPALRYLAFDPARPQMELSDLSFSEKTLADLKQRHLLFDATNTDLSAFQKAGGKLILWHGLADPHISPANTVAYHKGLNDTLGAAVVEGFERLYLLPGVSHCGGGQALSGIDLLSAMVDWVESGKAPDRIETVSAAPESRFGQPDFASAPGQNGPPPMKSLDVPQLPDMSRPVFPYPFMARYTGRGDWKQSANWEKGEAAEIVKLHPWPGAGFFAPFQPFDR